MVSEWMTNATMMVEQLAPLEPFHKTPMSLLILLAAIAANGSIRDDDDVYLNDDHDGTLTMSTSLAGSRY
jgi:hypothetical protein